MRPKPLRRAMAAAPTTPPAGPDNTVRTGSRAPVLSAVMPPLDCMTNTRPLDPPCQALQISLHHGLKVSIDHHRAGSLVFAELGKNLVRDGERQFRDFRQPFASARSCFGLAKENSRQMAMASACCPRNFPGKCFDLWRSDSASTISPSLAIRSSTPKRRSLPDQWRNAVKKEVVELGTRLPPNLNGIFESCRSHQRNPRALALQQSVGAHGGPMQKVTGPVPDFLTAAAIACEGSAGVEKTLAIRTLPSSTQTQSVKVPPVSTAMRRARGMRKARVTPENPCHPERSASKRSAARA